MAFQIPSRETLFQLFIGDYAGAQPDKNVARGSDPYRLGRVVSGAIWNLLAKLLFFDKQRLPDTAQAENLERWGRIYAFLKKAPQIASRDSALRATGVVGASVPANSELTHADGTRYKTTSVGAVINASGYVDVDVESITKGLAANKGQGETLTFVAPVPTDIDADARLVLALNDGLDLEEQEPYRARLLAHIGDPPEGGAVHDYIEWALSQAGVVSAYVWTHRRGRGTVDVAVLGSGTGANRVPSGSELTAVTDYIEGLRPANVKDWLLLTTTPQAQDVECTIEIDDTTYGWDWDDAGVGYVITAFDSTAKTITVPTAPDAVVTGVRLTVRGEEAIVTGRAGDVLTLTFEKNYDGDDVDWFTFAITTSVDEIRASGDLVKPTRNNIIALFNSLGPARLSGFAKTAWVGDLKLSKLFAAITDTTGVDDATIAEPSANVVPTDPRGATVPYLVPRYIKVLRG